MSSLGLGSVLDHRFTLDLWRPAVPRGVAVPVGARLLHAPTRQVVSAQGESEAEASAQVIALMVRRLADMDAVVLSAAERAWPHAFSPLSFAEPVALRAGRRRAGSEREPAGRVTDWCAWPVGDEVCGQLVGWMAHVAGAPARRGDVRGAGRCVDAGCGRFGRMALFAGQRFCPVEHADPMA